MVTERIKNEILTKLFNPKSKQLINELISIGQTKSYLPREPGRTREIGEELNKIGGINLMQTAHEQVYSSLGNVKARELESAWAGIGSWQG